MQGDDKLAAGLACPAGADDAVGVAFLEVVQVLAVGAVYLDGAVTGNESLHAVAKDGVAALGQLVVHAFHSLADDEDVVVVFLLVVGGLLQDKFLGCSSGRCGLILLGYDALILLDNGVHIDFSLLNGGIELDGGLVAHLLDHAGQQSIVGFNLAVLEPALQRLAGQLGLPSAPLVDGVLDLVAGAAGDGDVEPVEAWVLGRGGDDLDGVAAPEAVIDFLVLAIDLTAHAGAAHAGMDVVGKVEQGGTLGQAEQVPLGREHKHLVVIQVGVHVAHQVHLPLLATGLEHLAHLVHPLVHITLALDALVAPVCRHTALGCLVHASGAYLHFNPLVAGAIDGNVQRFITVALGDGDPVLET